MTSRMNHPCYTYCLIERKFMAPTSPGRHVIEFGLTRSGLFVRFSKYPKGSLLLSAVPVRTDRADAVQAEVIAYARKAFTQRADIGPEHFEAPPEDAIAVLVETASGFLPIHNDDTEDCEEDDQDDEDEDEDDDDEDDEDDDEDEDEVFEVNDDHDDEEVFRMNEDDDEDENEEENEEENDDGDENDDGEEGMARILSFLHREGFKVQEGEEEASKADGVIKLVSEFLRKP